LPDTINSIQSLDRAITFIGWVLIRLPLLQRSHTNLLTSSVDGEWTEQEYAPSADRVM
jgi:hypothetical protein